MLTSRLTKLSQTKPSQIKLSLVFVLLLGLCSCNSKELIGPKDTQHTMVTTTIVGEVVDESEKPVEGASVTAHGQTTTTDKNGIFFFHNIQAPSDRCFAVVKYNGYFDGVRAEQTRAGEVTRMKLTLGVKETAKLNATQGGLIKIGKASVQFAPNSIVTESGTPYSGEVTVAYKHLDPDADNFFDLFPGDFEAIRTDNSSTYLTSYGVLQVELSGSSGEKLNLASGKTATLAYPIPASLATNTPSSIPLWYFDEQSGIWKEEGSATKVGNTYVGTVTHFTPWNCDDPGPIGYLKAHFVCGSGPLEGVVVRIGQRRTRSSASGAIEEFVPANQEVTLNVDATDNNGLYYISKPITIKVATGETKDFGTLVLDSKCPAYIAGQLVGCDNKPRGGIVHAEFQGKHALSTTLDGNFFIPVPSGISIRLSAALFGGGFSPEVNINPLADDQELEIGTIKVCSEDNAKDFLFIPIEDVSPADTVGMYLAKFSYSGEYIAAVVHEYVDRYTKIPSLRIFDAKTGVLLHDIRTPKLSQLVSGVHLISWGSDDKKVLVYGSKSQGTLTILFDIEKEKEITVWEDSLQSAILLPTDQVAADRNSALSKDDRIGLYSLNGNLIETLPIQMQLGLNQSDELFTGGQYLFFTHYYKTEKWDLSSKKMIQTLDMRWLQSVSRNGEVVAGFPPGQSLTLADAANGALKVAPKSYWVAISNDNTYIAATPSQDGTTRIAALYDVATGSVVKVLDGQQENVRYNSFDFSEDGNYVLGYHTKGITVWKTK